ncbi:MAG: hypothetical protein KJO31_05200 [Gammaproteobacteria bacterium]|nr:hypothetical protein [Gammaproteobacteria bacterium]
MRETESTNRFAVAALGVVCALLLSGCETTRNWLQGRPAAEPDEVILGAPETNSYIDELFKLTSGDPATQAEIFADARAAAQLTPDPSTKLRYALVLATPGHSGSNELEAQSLFRELLARTELMTSGEIALANIHLREVEARLVLGAETRRLRSENLRNASSEEAAVAQRIASIEAENRQLRRSLSEAEDKLEAITSIELSIREQTENGE